MEDSLDQTDLGQPDETAFDPCSLWEAEGVDSIFAALPGRQLCSAFCVVLKRVFEVFEHLLQRLSHGKIEEGAFLGLLESGQCSAGRCETKFFSEGAKRPVPDEAATAREAQEELFLFGGRFQSELVASGHLHAQILPDRRANRKEMLKILATGKRCKTVPERAFGKRMNLHPHG
jgi:hypothetical protein